MLCPQHKPAGKDPRQPGPGSGPAPPEGDPFGSFLYWRPPLPSIEEELRELLVRICWSLFPVLALPFLAGLPLPVRAPLTSPRMAQAISGSPEPPEEHRSSADGASAGEEEEEDEESDDEGWITPSNLKQAQQDTGHCDTAPIGVQVGCVTTDFAMQVGAGLKPRGCSNQGRAESPGRAGESSFGTAPCVKPAGSQSQRPLQSLLGSPCLCWQGRVPAPGIPSPRCVPALAECAAADGAARAGCERDADPPCPELHPALPRLLQVPRLGWALAEPVCTSPGALTPSVPPSQDHLGHDQGVLPPLR